jgi:hypothetical protein
MPSCQFEADSSAWQAFEELSELWNSFPHEVRLQLERYLRAAYTDEDGPWPDPDDDEC